MLRVYFAGNHDYLQVCSVFIPIFKYRPTYIVQSAVECEKEKLSLLCKVSRGKRSKSANQMITADVDVIKLIIWRKQEKGDKEEK